MCACVEVDNWDTLDDICNGIYDGKFDLTLAPNLLQAIFKRLSWIIEPMYRQVSPWRNQLKGRLAGLKTQQAGQRSTLRQANDIATLFEILPMIMNVLGVYIAYDELLFQKLLRVLQPHYQN